MLACVCVWAEAQAHGLQQTHEAEWVASGRTPKTWAGQAPAGVSPGVGVAQGIEAQSTEGDHPRTYIAHHIAHQVIVVTDRQAYEELKDAAGASAVGSGAGGFEAAAACAPGPAAPASTAYVQGGLEVFRALTAAAPHAHEFVDARAATNASAQAAAAPSGSVSSVRGAPDEGQCAQVDGEEEQEQDVAEEAEQDEARRVQDVSPPPASVGLAPEAAWQAQDADGPRLERRGLPAGGSAQPEQGADAEQGPALSCHVAHERAADGPAAHGHGAVVSRAADVRLFLAPQPVLIGDGREAEHVSCPEDSAHPASTSLARLHTAWVGSKSLPAVLEILGDPRRDDRWSRALLQGGNSTCTGTSTCTGNHASRAAEASRAARCRSRGSFTILTRPETEVAGWRACPGPSVVGADGGGRGMTQMTQMMLSTTARPLCELQGPGVRGAGSRQPPESCSSQGAPTAVSTPARVSLLHPQSDAALGHDHAAL